ncbi:MAG: DUF523 domain-containing protein [Lentisphaeria bacterium]|nr:DUF523 domain-containing protein [Lentisphaeria bacterium]
MKKLKIAISACLIGLKYRYDGESRFSQTIVYRLKDKVDFIPVCPEVECGLSIPRPKMHLEASAKGTRMKVTDSLTDETDRMIIWAENKLDQLERMGISGYIFQARSPSCGLADAKLLAPGGSRVISTAETGIFAKMIKRRFPKLVIAEEKDLEEFCRQLGL